MKGQTFLAAAVVLGLAAAVVGYLSLTQIAARASSASRASTRPVVVMAADQTYGQKLEPTMLRVVNYPKDAVPVGAYSTIDSVVGQTTKVFMGTREPITALKLSSRGGGLSLSIHPGLRAASLEVNQVSGVSGFVLPGDHVDVLVTVRPRTSNEDPVTETVLQNVEVLAAGQKTQQENNKPITVQAVTLLVDPAGAQVLTHAMREGDVMLVLRSPEDGEMTKVASLSTGRMLGKVAPAPEKGRVLVRTVHDAAPRPSQPREVFMIRGGSVGKAAVPDSAR
ncbi:MAG TPA: Flp pilus assembly protein CpaB [Candidatus Udaeobacter sp.]|jgi:pilus assembly protein CpaB|nr:Flp pilus assembly protein CpaB [Candidatus Udaeobacter sp.]